MKLYHGTDAFIEILRTGSYATRSTKDAWKFGYRRAIDDGRWIVYLYTFECDPELLKIDNERDRAYITIRPMHVSLQDSKQLWAVPYKLGNFKK